MESNCPKCGARSWATFSDIDSTILKRFECGTMIVAVGLIQAPDCIAAERDHLRLQNAALTAEVERLRQSWTELRDAMVDMDRDCEDDLFENPSEALACCIELMDSIVTIEPKDRPDA